MTISAPAPPRPTTPPAGITLGAIGCAFVGASVPVSGLLTDYPLFVAQAVRYGLGAMLLLGWAAVAKVRIKWPTVRDLPAIVAIVGVGMLGFNATLLAAQRYAEPGFVAAVLGGSPLVIAVVAPLLAKRVPGVRPVVGAAVAVVGVVVLSGGGAWRGPGLVLAVLTMLAEAAFTLFAVGVIRRLGGFSVALWCHLVAAVVGAGLGVVEGYRAPSGREVAAVVGVAVLTVVAFCLWYRCVEVVGADRAAVLIGAMPVAGLAASVAMGAQPLTIAGVVGAAVVAAGCAVGLRR